MHIGAVELHSPLVLAPMAGLTDAPFRRLLNIAWWETPGVFCCLERGHVLGLASLALSFECSF